ncbi:hypothetical protein HK104_010817, partial [Borealophlyctis nickersoniae]
MDPLYARLLNIAKENGYAVVNADDLTNDPYTIIQMCIRLCESDKKAYQKAFLYTRNADIIAKMTPECD